MLRRNWRRCLALLLIWGNLSSAQKPPSEATTGIEGIVIISPTRPGPSRVGSEKARAPLPDAVFTIANKNNGAVTSFTTGADGRFRVLLQSGHYVVSLAEHRFPRPCGPFEVEVVSGKMTPVEWHCDTGMR